jgi:hypothetical protein
MSRARVWLPPSTEEADHLSRPSRPMAMPPPLAGVVRLAAASRLLVLALSRLLFHPLRHVRVTPPTLPLLLLLPSFLPLHESLRRRLVAGRMGRRPLLPHRRVWLRVRAVLRLPPAPPRLACAPRAIP